jgi:ABC-type nickel/cobalt efflux system permease component RcnA
LDRKIAGLLGVVAALGTVTSSQAAPIAAPSTQDVLQANSYADLLTPIPNAGVILQAMDKEGAAAGEEATLQTAQYHHHHHYRRRHHHHHHHHY